MESRHGRLNRTNGAIMNCMAVVCCLVWPGLLAAVEVDLFVTDYGEEPSSEQRPLADRPLRYVNPQQVTIKMTDGELVTYDTPLRVVVDRRGGANPKAGLDICLDWRV